MQQRLGDTDALPHSLGKTSYPAVAPRQASEEGQNFRDTPRHILNPREGREKGEVLLDRQVIVETHILGHISDALPHGQVVTDDIVAADLSPS